MMQSAKCEIEFSEGILIINLYGDIDHHTAKKLREDIDEKIILHRGATVILDLAHIEFMDSSGLGLILGRYTKINNLGGKLILCNPTPEITKILSLAGADKLITIRKERGAKV